MSAESKERQKLTSTWLNALSTGSITAGVIAPIIALQVGVTQPSAESDVIAASALWLAGGVFLHIFALVYLIGLEE